MGISRRESIQPQRMELIQPQRMENGVFFYSLLGDRLPSHMVADRESVFVQPARYLNKGANTIQWPPSAATAMVANAPVDSLLEPSAKRCNELILE
ncbi:hypothetical protein IFM89_019860 [Coptis chinensis]|uniref:Uncharacterized protein n=1 Tax=Coptis chinensis TaxID=261450 RepID=A0A835IXD9_9MAGN|nr:hypothetical protein IFM89_019860 [Coptis chinensis]